METYSQITRELSSYENKWVKALDPLPPRSLPNWNGAIQFVGVEPGVAAPASDRLPVIVTVGLNHDQGPNLDRRLRWLRDVKGRRDGVTNCHWSPGTPSPMRRALDWALAAQNRNPLAWSDCLNGTAHASLGTALDLGSNYIVVAANLSPFITDVKWTEHLQGPLREAWSRMDHLHDLADLIGDRVDLWIGHGSREVWETFLRWLAPSKHQPWMLTYHLNSVGLASMRKVGADLKYPLHTLYA